MGRRRGGGGGGRGGGVVRGGRVGRRRDDDMDYTALTLLGRSHQRPPTPPIRVTTRVTRASQRTPTATTTNGTNGTTTTTGEGRRPQMLALEWRKAPSPPPPPQHNHNAIVPFTHSDHLLSSLNNMQVGRELAEAVSEDSVHSVVVGSVERLMEERVAVGEMMVAEEARRKQLLRSTNPPTKPHVDGSKLLREALAKGDTAAKVTFIHYSPGEVYEGDRDRCVHCQAPRRLHSICPTLVIKPMTSSVVYKVKRCSNPLCPGPAFPKKEDVSQVEEFFNCPLNVDVTLEDQLNDPYLMEGVDEEALLKEAMEMNYAAEMAKIQDQQRTLFLHEQTIINNNKIYQKLKPLFHK